MNAKDFFKKHNVLDEIVKSWDNVLNGELTDETTISYSDKIWIKCPNGLHKSELKRVDSILRSSFKGYKCLQCNSFGQYIVDNYGDDFLKQIWSDKNKKSPFDYSRKSGQKAWFRCRKGMHPDEEKVICDYVVNNCNCRRCSIERQHDQQRINLTGNRYGNWTVVGLDRQSSDYYGVTYWYCDCDCGTKHKSVYYQNLIKGTSLSCGCRRNENSGKNHYNWKGGITPITIKDRNSVKYKEWRDKIFKRDNYTCQCCLCRGDKLNLHHILNYSNNKDLRYDDSNAITLCERCHSIRYKGSFHNVFGTSNNTMEQLVEYINDKRKQLGINICFTTLEGV